MRLHPAALRARLRLIRAPPPPRPPPSTAPPTASDPSTHLPSPSLPAPCPRRRRGHTCCSCPASNPRRPRPRRGSSAPRTPPRRSTQASSPAPSSPRPAPRCSSPRRSAWWSRTAIGAALAELILDVKAKIFDLEPFSPATFLKRRSRRGA
ncbi:hypothetical protein ACP70R_001611 [Stipagrostis hirtigluma subsp. patula]